MNTINKIKGVGLLLLLTLCFTACSDVELEPATYSEAVSNLVAEYTQGSRQVTLRWDNPTMSGQSGNLASNATIEALKAFTADGGNLLLTNHATQLTVALGRIAEAYAPGIYGNGDGGQNNDIWGSQPIIGNAEGQIYDHSGHDIYWGMDFVSGLYERSIYTFSGRILAVGLAAYEWNIDVENTCQSQLEPFTSNCIGYLK